MNDEDQQKNEKRLSYSELKSALDELQRKYVALICKPNMPNFGQHPKCIHGHDMDTVPSRNCGSCVKNPEESARVELEKATVAHEKTLTAANDKIRKLEAVVEYLESKYESR